MFQMWFNRSWSLSWPSGLEFLTPFSALTQNRKPYPDRAFLFIELNFLANFLWSTGSSLLVSKQYANHRMEVRRGGYWPACTKHNPGPEQKTNNGNGAWLSCLVNTTCSYRLENRLAHLLYFLFFLPLLLTWISSVSFDVGQVHVCQILSG